MKILFDLIASQPDKTSKFHGGSEYCKSVFLKVIDEINDGEIEVVIDPNREVDGTLIKLCEKNNIVINECTDINSLNILLRDKKFSKFYSALPYGYSNLKIDESIEFIYTIHGLRELEMIGDKYQLKFEKWTLKGFAKDVIRRIYPQVLIKKRKNKFERVFNLTMNRKILVASYHTKYAIMNFFPHILGDEIKVLYSPAKKSIEIESDKEKGVLEKYHLEKKKYILLVSGDRWLKNNYRAIKAIDELYSQKNKLLENIKVILLGVEDKEQYLNDIKNKENFVIEGYKSTEELEILYKNAHLFVYPTLNEGFGYPPLEAMKYETIIAVSAISSITEICGDAVLYFNPYDLNEIKNRVLESFDYNITSLKKEKMKVQYEYISCIQEKSLENIAEIILE